MSNLSIFNPPPPSELDRLSNRLLGVYCLTHYHKFCLRIAERSLDLPVAHWRLRQERKGVLLRHEDRLDSWSVQRWLLEASRMSQLAAMVLLDAMDFFCDCLRLLTDSYDHELFDSRFKQEFTQSTQGTPFIFRIPAGWELSLFHHTYDEGNYGVGYVVRCHLWQSTTHENWALGELLGRGNSESSDIGYFGVPCEIVPQFKRTPIDADDERWTMRTVTAAIPYQWIIETRNRHENDRRGYLHPVSSEQEILDVVSKAVEAVKERVAEIEARMNQREGTSGTTDTGADG